MFIFSFINLLVVQWNLPPEPSCWTGGRIRSDSRVMGMEILWENESEEEKWFKDYQKVIKSKRSIILTGDRCPCQWVPGGEGTVAEALKERKNKRKKERKIHKTLLCVLWHYVVFHSALWREIYGYLSLCKLPLRVSSIFSICSIKTILSVQ